MADDAPMFNPPLGDFQPPTISMNGQAIVDAICAWLRDGVAGIEISPGCAARAEEGVWVPLVLCTVPGSTLYLGVATAREVAVRIADNPLVRRLYGESAPQVGLSFAEAADRAEDLAAGRAPFTNPQEMN